MKILALDTSSMVAAVAVMDSEKLLGEYVLNQNKTHSQKLMPMIDELLKGLELKPADIDIYAASSGPGSFTGLRIGMTTVKALAYAVQKPVVSVPTLDALAYNIPMTDSLVCPIMDARNNQVYTAVYKWEKGRQAKLTEYMGIPVDQLVSLVKGKNNRTIFLGDGVKQHRDFIKEQLGDKCDFAPVSLLHQKAASVAQVAFIKAAEGEFESSFNAVPFYLRKSQAEREYEKKQKKGSCCC